MPHDDLVSNNLKNPDYCSVFGPLRQWWWTLNVISWVLGGVHLKTGVMWRLQQDGNASAGGGGGGGGGGGWWQHLGEQQLLLLGSRKPGLESSC